LAIVALGVRRGVPLGGEVLEESWYPILF